MPQNMEGSLNPQLVCFKVTECRESTGRYATNGMHVDEISNTLHWRHNELDSVSNHHSHHCLLNRLFGRRSKKTSKLRVTGLCAGNSPGTGEFPAQMASYAENVSIWWRHHMCRGEVGMYLPPLSVNAVRTRPPHNIRMLVNAMVSLCAVI